MRFRADPQAERGIRRQPEFQAFLRGVTTIVAGEIRIAAMPYRATGYYLQRIKARGNTVRFEDVFWHLSEFGSVNNPPQCNALRGVRAAGLRFVDEGASQAE